MGHPHVSLVLTQAPECRAAGLGPCVKFCWSPESTCCEKLKKGLGYQTSCWFLSPFWANILFRSIVYSFIFENVFLWISFPLNVVSETSLLENNLFHGVVEYNTQSGQILNFKDAIFFSFLQVLFSVNCLETIDIPSPSLLQMWIVYCHTIWKGVKIRCPKKKNPKMYKFWFSFFLAFWRLKFCLFYVKNIREFVPYKYWGIIIK